jgi:hypothetical protein
MPDHVRQQIRDAVVTGLTGLTTTGSRVYPGRTRPLAKGHDATLLVYTRSETGERTVQGAPGKITRRCLLDIEGRVSTAGVPDDMLDTIASEIETAMAALINFGTARVLGGLAMNLEYLGTDIIAEADGERHDGGVRVQYRVTYRTVEGAPTVAA